MAHTPNRLPLPCPHCKATLAEIAALSRTVITLTCGACGHGWSLSVDWLPASVLMRLGGMAVATYTQTTLEAAWRRLKADPFC
jgi:hypothetical protein